MRRAPLPGAPCRRRLTDDACFTAHTSARPALQGQSRACRQSPTVRFNAVAPLSRVQAGTPRLLPTMHSPRFCIAAHRSRQQQQSGLTAFCSGPRCTARTFQIAQSMALQRQSLACVARCHTATQQPTAAAASYPPGGSPGVRCRWARAPSDDLGPTCLRVPAGGECRGAQSYRQQLRAGACAPALQQGRPLQSCRLCSTLPAVTAHHTVAVAAARATLTAGTADMFTHESAATCGHMADCTEAACEKPSMRQPHSRPPIPAVTIACSPRAPGPAK